PRTSPLLPYTTLFRSRCGSWIGRSGSSPAITSPAELRPSARAAEPPFRRRSGRSEAEQLARRLAEHVVEVVALPARQATHVGERDRKSTRLNSSHQIT